MSKKQNPVTPPADGSTPPSVEVDTLQAKVAELTADLQRTRADFENYRKRVELEKTAARQAGEQKATKALLPVLDTVERAITHVPDDIAGHTWVKGITGLTKQLDKITKELGLEKIAASAGTPFDPSVHQAVQMDEDAEGDTEVIAAELQTGYRLNGLPIRDAMVKVTRK